jgi:hypothetical protein
VPYVGDTGNNRVVDVTTDGAEPVISSGLDYPMAVAFVGTGGRVRR